MGLFGRLSSWRPAAVPPDRRLSREAALTITIHSLFQFGASMAGLFLNLYLWRLTEDLVVNGVYNIVLYATTPLGFALGGWIAKRKDRLVTYRLGILMTALFFLLVIIARENLIPYFMLFALLNGFASGLYWVGYLVLMYDVSTDANRIRYLGLNMVFFNAAGLIGPALAGAIIGWSEGLSGYMIAFSASFALFVMAAIVSLRIRASHSRHKSYYLNLMPLLMRKNSVWMKALLGFFTFGLFQGVMMFLPTILLYQTVGREDWVGYFGVCFSSIIIATGYVLSRKASEAKARLYILMSSSAMSAGAAILLYDVRLWTVIVFMVLFSVSNPLALNTLNTYYYRLIGKLPLKGQLRNEAVVMRESFLNCGRIVSIIFLLLFSRDLQSVWLPVMLLVAALLQFLIYFTVKPNK